MQVFKTRAFARWVGADGLGDAELASAVAEMERGLARSREARWCAHPVGVQTRREGVFRLRLCQERAVQHQRQGTEGLEAVGEGITELSGSITDKSDQSR